MSRRNIKVAKQLIRLAKELAASGRRTRGFRAGEQGKEITNLWDVASNISILTIFQDLQDYVDDLQDLYLGNARIYNDFIQKKSAERDWMLLKAEQLGEAARTYKKEKFSLAGLQNAEAFTQGLYDIQLEVDPNTYELVNPYKTISTKHPNGLNIRTEGQVRIHGYDWDPAATNRVTGNPGSWVKPHDANGRPILMKGIGMHNIGLYMLRQEQLATEFQALGSWAFANNASFGNDEKFHRVAVPLNNAQLFMAFGSVVSDKEKGELFDQLGLLSNKHYNIAKSTIQQVASTATGYKIQVLLLNKYGEIIAFHDTWDLGLKQLHQLGHDVMDWKDVVKKQLMDPKMSGLMRRLYPNIDPVDSPTVINEASCRTAGMRFASRMRRAGMLDWIKEKVSGIWNKIKDTWNSMVSSFKSFEAKIKKDYNEYKSLLNQYISESNSEEEILRSNVDEVKRLLDDIYDTVNKFMAKRKGNNAVLEEEAL